MSRKFIVSKNSHLQTKSESHHVVSISLSMDEYTHSLNFSFQLTYRQDPEGHLHLLALYG